MERLYRPTLFYFCVFHLDFAFHSAGVAMNENKKYALFVKQKAEEALSLHDFVEAKTFLNIARLLFPNLDGVEQMLAVVDVHIAAQLKIGGSEMDWYAILQVDPSADDNTIKEQHRKLALTLYPEIAEAALGLAEEAWAQALELIAEALGVLSNKGKRALYDMKRISFWTLCPSCKIRHHLPRVYENCELPCPSCGLGFVTRDTNLGGVNAMANGGPSNNGPSNVGVFQTHGTAGYDTDGSVESVSQMNNISKADKGNNARADEGWDLAGKRRENVVQKEAKENNLAGKRRENVALKEIKEYEKREEAKLQKEKQKSRKRPERSKDEVENDVEEHVYGGLSKQKSRKRPERSKDEIENDVEEHVYGGLSTEVTFSSQPRRSKRRTQHVSFISPYKSLDVYNFDADRLEESIKQGQIWATYDYDGMPRLYCQIMSVHSAKPFGACIKWLDSCRTAQMKMWQKAGLYPLPFGEFVLGSSSKRSVPVGQFSHIMECIEGSLTIYPQQGQVWALYKDWMPQWPSLNRYEVYLRKQNYETVLVVTGFSEQKGLDVVSLHNESCYVSLFQKTNESVRHIRSEEIYRFSHMIPAHQLKGDEIPNMPKECWVLDPIALNGASKASIGIEIA